MNKSVIKRQMDTYRNFQIPVGSNHNKIIIRIMEIISTKQYMRLS